MSTRTEKLAPTGNVFRDPDSGVILNPTNIVHRNTNKTTGWNDPNAPADATPAVAGTGPSVSGEMDEEGRTITSEDANTHNVRDTLAAIQDTVQLSRQGNRAAIQMLSVMAKAERSRPDRGRSTVLRQLERAGV